MLTNHFRSSLNLEIKKNSGRAALSTTIFFTFSLNIFDDELFTVYLWGLWPYTHVCIGAMGIIYNWCMWVLLFAFDPSHPYRTNE